MRRRAFFRTEIGSPPHVGPVVRWRTVPVDIPFPPTRISFNTHRSTPVDHIAGTYSYSSDLALAFSIFHTRSYFQDVVHDGHGTVIRKSYTSANYQYPGTNKHNRKSTNPETPSDQSIHHYTSQSPQTTSKHKSTCQHLTYQTINSVVPSLHKIIVLPGTAQCFYKRRNRGNACFEKKKKKKSFTRIGRNSSGYTAWRCQR